MPTTRRRLSGVANAHVSLTPLRESSQWPCLTSYDHARAQWRLDVIVGADGGPSHGWPVCDRCASNVQRSIEELR